MREAGPGGSSLGQAVPSAQLPPTPFSSVSMLLSRVCSTYWVYCVGAAGASDLCWNKLPESGDRVFSLGFPTLLPWALLVAHAQYVPVTLLTCPLPAPRSHGRRQLRRRRSVPRKGRVTRWVLGTLLAGAGGMVHTLSQSPL